MNKEMRSIHRMILLPALLLLALLLGSCATTGDAEGRNDDLQAENARLKAQVEELTASLQRLRSSLQAESDRAVALQNRLSEIERRYDTLTAHVQEALKSAGSTSDVGSIVEQNKQLQKENDLLRGIIDDLLYAESLIRPGEPAPERPPSRRSLPEATPASPQPPAASLPRAESVPAAPGNGGTPAGAEPEPGSSSTARDTAPTAERPLTPFREVPTVTPPAPKQNSRSPLAGSGIISQIAANQRDRLYFAEGQNFSRADSVFLYIVLPSDGQPLLHLVGKISYPVSQDPLYLQRITVSAVNGGSTSLAPSAGRVSREHDGRQRSEYVDYTLSAAEVRALQRLITEARLSATFFGESRQSARPLSAAEQRALLDVLYAFSRMSGSA